MFLVRLFPLILHRAAMSYDFVWSVVNYQPRSLVPICAYRLPEREGATGADSEFGRLRHPPSVKDASLRPQPMAFGYC
jgi:hypothetical protein